MTSPSWPPRCVTEFLIAADQFHICVSNNSDWRGCRPCSVVCRSRCVHIKLVHITHHSPNARSHARSPSVIRHSTEANLSSARSATRPVRKEISELEVRYDAGRPGRSSGRYRETHAGLRPLLNDKAVDMESEYWVTESSCSISPSVSAKSKTCALLSIRSLCADFGMTIKPR